MIPFLLFAISIQPAQDGVPPRQPQPAASPGMAAMTYGAGSSIYFASSPDGGRSFDAPVKVDTVGALALGRHRGPRLVILRDSLVITAVAGRSVAPGPHAHGLPENGDLAVWRSSGNGAAWTRAGVINDVPGAAREGLHAIAAGPDGTLFAVWLDLRGKGTQLYGARSKDGGLTWSKNVLVYSSPDGAICQCCHPSLAFDGSGMRVMWRNAVDGSRDLYMTRSADGIHFEPARKLGGGTWKINACPMDGGGFVVSNEGAVTSAWRRGEEIFLLEPGRPEQSLGSGKDVAIARGKDGIYLAWTKEGAVWVKTPRDAAPRAAGAGGFASLVALADGAVLAAWEGGGAIHTLRLP